MKSGKQYMNKDYQQRDRNYRREPEILELKNTVTELKNSLDGINSRLNQAEQRSSDLRDWSFEIVKSKEHKKMKKSEESLRDLRTPSAYTLWESKEKRGRMEQSAYVKI